MRTGYCTRIHADEFLIDIDDGRPQRQRSAVGHRIARVDNEVHENLLDLTAVGAYACACRAQLDHETDVLADQRAQQITDIFDDAIQLDHAWLQHLPPRERQQLLRQRSSAVRGKTNLFDV